MSVVLNPFLTLLSNISFCSFLRSAMLHVAIVLNLLMNELALDARFFKNLFTFFTCMIVLVGNHSFYPRIDDHFSAHIARQHVAIHGRTLKGDAHTCRLNNSILFGVNGTYTMF